MGYRAGFCMQGDTNIAIGKCALAGSTTKSNNTGSQNIAIGQDTADGLTSGGYNVFMGYQVANSGTITGTNNVSIGCQTSRSLTSGADNIYIGRQAGDDNTTGDCQIYLGMWSGRYMRGDHNIALGCQAL